MTAIEKNLKKNEPLSKHTTFAIGGPASYFCEVRTFQQLQEVLLYSHQNHLPHFILGKGSNILFDDRGWKGMVILNRIDFCHFQDNRIEVGAGYSFSLLGTQSAKKGFSGLEFASGIPATVGGAVFMNAGANGKETCDSLHSVTYVTSDGEEKTHLKKDLEFRYRFSSFQKMNGAIASATFLLREDPNARKAQFEIISKRIATQPLKEKSAGCIFRNPSSSLTSGALIEECGLKGKDVGGSKISEVHANFIVNDSKATSRDVQELISFVQTEVKKKKNVDLEAEVRYIPYNG